MPPQPPPTVPFTAVPGAVAPDPPAKRKRTNKIILAVIGTVLLCVCGPIITVGALLSDDPEQTPDTPATTAPVADPPTTASPTLTSPTAATSSVVATPVVENRTVIEKQKVPYQTRTVKDSSLRKGTRKVAVRGVAGVKTLTYQVTLTDGVETAKKLIRSQITKAPVTQVVRVGTKVTQQCHPNYSGACVPIASDVDCAGGSGNGPAYVEGPVRIIGTDIYDLDGNNKNGIGCED